MTDVKMNDEDPILPARIAHKCEEIWNAGKLEQRYNYLWYEFEIGARLYRARAYLDEIRTVSILGVTEGDQLVQDPEIEPRIVAYFRRRFKNIQKLGATGYVQIP